MMACMPRLSVGTLGAIMPPGTNLVQNAQRSEAKGFDAIWWPDHYMGWFPQSLWTLDITQLAAFQPNPHVFFDSIAAIAAVAARTERVRLGTAVTDALRRHPVQLAQAFLTLDHLAPGRIVCGLGSGEAENLVPYGVAFDQPVAKLEEALAVIRLLWQDGGPVSFEGRFFRLQDAVLGLRPGPSGPPPIWLAAHGPRMLALAARYADGWLPTYMPVEDYRPRLAQLRDGVRAGGRDPARFTPGMYAAVVLADSHEAAHRLIQAPLLRALALIQPASAFEAAGAVHPLGSQASGIRDFIPSRLGRTEALELLDRIPAAVAESATLHGTAEEVAEQLQHYHAAGLQHVVLWNVTFFADASLVRSSYALLDRVRQLLTEARVA